MDSKSGDGFYGHEDDDSDAPAAKEDNKNMAETSLLPKSMFGNHDPKPGEEYVFEVVRLYEGEVEIKYSPKKENDGEEEKVGMDEANDALEGMAKESKSGY